MADKKLKPPKEISRKKQVYLELTATLTNVLAGLKDELGEKKFEGRIQKAAKLLSAGIKTKKTKTKTADKKNKATDNKDMTESAKTN